MPVTPIDVSAVVEGGIPALDPLRMSASLFVPATGPGETLMVCLAGASYAKTYFHPEFPDADSYSFAQAMCGRGINVLLIDHPGMGESDRPENAGLIGRESAAAFHDALLQSVLARFTNGEWGTARISQLVGIAHSMGSMVLLEWQALFARFDRLALLGWTNIGIDFDTAVLDALAASPGYTPTDRAMMRPIFHMEDVPLAIIEADDAAMSLTPSGLAVEALTPGIARDAAAAIAVPVLAVYGERDISPDPSQEASYYPNSAEAQLFMLAGSAHNHNFASTRAVLWDHLRTWAAAPSPATIQE